MHCHKLEHTCTLTNEGSTVSYDNATVLGQRSIKEQYKNAHTCSYRSNFYIDLAVCSFGDGLHVKYITSQEMNSCKRK